MEWKTNFKNLESLSDCCTSSLSKGRSKMVREVDLEGSKGLDLMVMENLPSLHARYEKQCVGISHTFIEIELENLVDVQDIENDLVY